MKIYLAPYPSPLFPIHRFGVVFRGKYFSHNSKSTGKRMLDVVKKWREINSWFFLLYLPLLLIHPSKIHQPFPPNIATTRDLFFWQRSPRSRRHRGNYRQRQLDIFIVIIAPSCRPAMSTRVGDETSLTALSISSLVAFLLQVVISVSTSHELLENAFWQSTLKHS